MQPGWLPFILLPQQSLPVCNYLLSEGVISSVAQLNGLSYYENLFQIEFLACLL